MKDYNVYTDGAYSPSTNKGGVGIAFISDNKLILQYSKLFLNTTNNRMELAAVIIALKCLKNKINKLTIYSDSQYVIGCITKGWKRNKNQDLWKVFDKIEKKAKELCTIIEYKWTHGHADDKWNNFVDNLAVKASHEIY